MADGQRPDPQPGWRQVALVAAAAVAVVVGAGILTGLLPEGFQDLIYQTPLAIVVLIVGTGWLLWRISRRAPKAPDQ